MVSSSEPAPRTARQPEVPLDTAILEAARDILALEGLDGLSMRAVAERVGVSATAIYHYFAGKQDLVDRVVESGFRRFTGYLAEAVARERPGSLERIGAVGEAYIRFALENREYFRVIFSVQPTSPRVVEDLPGGGGYRLLRTSIDEAMAQGEMRSDIDPDTVALYLWSVVHGLVTLELACRLHGPSAEHCAPSDVAHPSPVATFGAFRSLIAAGLRPPPASHSCAPARAGGDA